MVDITQRDLYELLAVDETASSPEISTAFRKKALTCHPDKYPNDEEKKNLFLLVKQALELLTDEQARKAYDATRKQKKLHQERLSHMDEKRKKFKQDLERNEQKATQTGGPVINKNDAQRLKAEVERLRREGSRLVDEELEKLRVILEEDKQKLSANHVHVIVKYLPSTTAYSDAELRLIFGKYGVISTIINMFPKRALVEFNDDHISSLIENEKGLPDRPFASVKFQKQKTTPTTSTASKQPLVVDLTKPELEDHEAMVFRKIAARTAAS